MQYKLLQKLGQKTLDFFQEFGQVVKLLGGIVKNFSYIPKSKKLIIFQMEHIGVNSLPLVLIIAVFTGAVAAW
ncbi:MAG: ABC transporter permease, partial [Bacteroidota bacterium]|nr:ABC transporter permease [Bacteroidota bacterium]